MWPHLSSRPASGAQRLVCLIPALFLLGVSDTALPTAACAAAMVGAAWQVVYRRPLAARMTWIAAWWSGAVVLVLVGVATWPVQAVPVTALAVLVMSLVGTEQALRAGDRALIGRDDRSVPAGT